MIILDEDVLKFQVSMDDVIGMQFLHRAQQLTEKGNRLPLIQHPKLPI